MEARIQYAKTSDGVDIAFTVYGDGPTIVIPPNIMNSHLQLELMNAPLAGFLQRLSSRLRVVRYDPRGIGMSQRDCVDFSAEAMERDLLAVMLTEKEKESTLRNTGTFKNDQDSNKGGWFGRKK